MQGMLQHENYECEYLIYGVGKRIMFAFHGFGNHASDFKGLEEELGIDYTIISVNLFFHGNSSILRRFVEEGFSTEDMKELMQSLMSRFPAEKYSLIGFSLGGRIALKLVELFPDLVDRLYLLAPDGLIVSRFYKYSTFNKTGRKLFNWAKDQPNTLIRLAGILKKLRLLDDKKYQLAMYHLESKEYRYRVYDVWMVFRRIRPKLEQIRTTISEKKISVDLFFGKYDRIILAEWGAILQKGLEKQVNTTLIDTGHQLFRSPFLEQIAGKIKNDAE